MIEPRSKLEREWDAEGPDAVPYADLQAAYLHVQSVQRNFTGWRVLETAYTLALQAKTTGVPIEEVLAGYVG
jgi:hypothetical protein